MGKTVFVLSAQLKKTKEVVQQRLSCCFPQAANISVHVASASYSTMIHPLFDHVLIHAAVACTVETDSVHLNARVHTRHPLLLSCALMLVDTALSHRHGIQHTRTHVQTHTRTHAHNTAHLCEQVHCMCRLPPLLLTCILLFSVLFGASLQPAGESPPPAPAETTAVSRLCE